MLRNPTLKRSLWIGLSACSIMLILPLSLIAQETAQQPEPPAKSAESAETTGEAPPHHRGEYMREMHERMEAMHKEMNTELQQRLTALREHSQAMAKITDTQQLVAEMKKHQQFTDALLGAMIEQHQRMHAIMHGSPEQKPEHGGPSASPGCCSMKQKEPPAPQ
ncbi:MAG: hypothetical protein HY267_02455 [Deltaproteobacteria bacterium]|nr:hypothetical protein [Deltaproteobacteria bacterium]